MGAFRTAVVIGICIAPSATFSIGPRLAALIGGTAALDGETAGFLIFQTAATLVLACCGPAFDRAETVTKKLAALGLGLMLACVQFLNALEVTSHSRDNKAAVASGSITEAAGTLRELAAARASRDRLPDPTPVTAAMVEAAKTASADAKASRDGECERRGNLCRRKEDELTAANQHLAEVEARFAIFVRIRELEERQRQAGPAPKHEDGAAYRIGRLLAALGLPMGGDPAQTVIEWWPVVIAAATELIAAVGPYVLLGRHETPRAPGRVWRLLRRRHGCAGEAQAPTADADKPAAAPVKTAVRKAAATPPKSRLAKHMTAGAAVAPVRDWLADRTTTREGHDLKSSEAFDDYKAFAESRGEAAANLTAFGLTLKEIGVEKITTPSKRTYYRGIALRSPRLAIVAA